MEDKIQRSDGRQQRKSQEIIIDRRSDRRWR